MDDTIEKATAALLADVAEKGQRWLKTANDWRRDLVGDLRAAEFELMSTSKIQGIKSGFAKKMIERVEIENTQHFIVQPFGPANNEKWAPTIGIEARPNKDNLVQVGFFVAFFAKKPISLDKYALTAFGHRFDAPEGERTTHNYYHIQPLKGWKNGATLPGAFQVQPDTFPTFPLEANDTLDLLLHTLHVACGAKYIEELAMTKISSTVAKRAAELHRRLNPIRVLAQK